jgi:hypothetical protein
MREQTPFSKCSPPLTCFTQNEHPLRFNTVYKPLAFITPFLIHNSFPSTTQQPPIHHSITLPKLANGNNSLSTFIIATIMALISTCLGVPTLAAIVSLSLSNRATCDLASQTLDLQTHHCYSINDTNGMRVVSHAAGLESDARK